LAPRFLEILYNPVIIHLNNVNSDRFLTSHNVYVKFNTFLKTFPIFLTHFPIKQQNNVTHNNECITTYSTKFSSKVNDIFTLRVHPATTKQLKFPTENNARIKSLQRPIIYSTLDTKSIIKKISKENCEKIKRKIF